MAPGCVTGTVCSECRGKGYRVIVNGKQLPARQGKTKPESANDRGEGSPQESAVRAIVSGATLAACCATRNESPAAEDKAAGPSWRSMSPGMTSPTKSLVEISDSPMPYLSTVIYR